jgi:probable rRNA maturation factor
MIDFENNTDFEVDIDELQIIADYITDRDFELVLVDSDTMQTINKKYRGVDKATDVLSFPIEIVADKIPIGTIIICVDFLSKADRFAHSPQEELKLLLIHGILHLLGYDHEIDNGEMREKEREIIEHFNLPKSLIIRSEQ